MGIDKYINQVENLNNNSDIQSKFGDLINDYLKSKKGTEESNLFLQGIIGETNKLTREEQEILIEFINEKRKKATGDDKLQLLELWATLSNRENVPLKEDFDNVEKLEDIGLFINRASMKIRFIDGKKEYKLYSGESELSQIGPDLYILTLPFHRDSKSSLRGDINIKLKIYYDGNKVYFIDNYGKKSRNIIKHSGRRRDHGGRRRRGHNSVDINVPSKYIMNNTSVKDLKIKLGFMD